jgi:integrase
MARATPGIVTRHSRTCPSRKGGACGRPCTPSFEAWVYDARSGKKIRRSFPTLSAAKGWRSDASAAVRRGALRATSASVTLREAALEWLDAAERGEVLSRNRRPYKPSVLRGYRADLERYVFPLLGSRRLASVTADDFQALVDRLVGDGKSGSKVRNVLVPAQALYRRHRRQVLANPTDGLDLPAPGGRRDRAATPTEAARLLEALPEGHRPLWACAFYAGLRRGELRALRCCDVDFAASAIRVRRGWDDFEGPIDPKSLAGVRDVPLVATLAAILEAHLERTGRSGEDLVFGRTRSAPFTPTHVAEVAAEAWASLAVAEFARRAAGLGASGVDVDRYTLHEGRHSFSTYLDAAGISETRADRYMGHSNPSVASRYRHQLAGQLVEDAARLDAYLTGATAGKVVAIGATGARSGAHALESAPLSQTG